MQDISSINFLPICCPLCKQQLQEKDKIFICLQCDRTFPVVNGIPDFRVFGDPYLGFEDDYKRTRLVIENLNSFDFRGLLEFYWNNSPETPKDLRENFIRGVLEGESKSNEILTTLKSFDNKSDAGIINVLEIGCGTGGFLVPAARKFPSVIGVDIALRWLFVARKRFEEAGIEVPLICCCAEYLPFQDEVFDLVVGAAALEHARYQDKVVSESHRVLRSKGKLFISTPNRYSLSVEPHVYVWGVGFLPRGWMQRYVRLIKGVDYKNIRLLSYFELRQLIKTVFSSMQVFFPNVDDESLGKFSRWERIQIKLYRWLRSRSLFKPFLLLFGPMYHVICHKSNGRGR
jgi:ubiquinone/menaquinone biosynthesis C-methylase UbiE